MTNLEQEVATLIKRLEADGLMVTSAESCTGGMIAAAFTDIAGSSAVFERGFVTYSNTAKTQMLGVPADLIASHGAVSAPVAKVMAEGALQRSEADIAVSVTGIAGPGGGAPDKPVGTVHFGCAAKNRETLHSHQLFSDMNRAEVREASVLHALQLIEAQRQAADSAP